MIWFGENLGHYKKRISLDNNLVEDYNLMKNIELRIDLKVRDMNDTNF